MPDRPKPHNVPNATKKWASVDRHIQKRHDDIERIVSMRKDGFLQGSPLRVDGEFRDMIRIGYAMAMEDFKVNDW